MQAKALTLGRSGHRVNQAQGCLLAVCALTVEPAAQYVLMAIAITLMVPFYQIDVLAPFSAAFTKIPGWGWCQYLVSVGAVFGIGTVLLVRGPRRIHVLATFLRGL